MIKRFVVWNGTTINPKYQNIAHIRDAVLALRPLTPTGRARWSLEWAVKAGEGGTWQSAFDPHPMSLHGADHLGHLVRLGRELRPPLRVTPYVNVRGRAEWNEAEWDQIVDCARAARRVILNVEPGDQFWNGPTDQGELQEVYTDPLSERLRREAPGAWVEVAMVPLPGFVARLGGVGCLAAWMSLANHASWECYEQINQDLAPDQSIPRVRGWAAETGWGQGARYEFPIVDPVAVGKWANSTYGRYGLGVWHLDGVDGGEGE